VPAGTYGKSCKPELFSLALVDTPNVNETFAILGEPVDEAKIEDCAAAIYELGPRSRARNERTHVGGGRRTQRSSPRP
jgi:hydroxymethylpyrimidine/phosphomethylpyrimidine kinase